MYDPNDSAVNLATNCPTSRPGAYICLLIKGDPNPEHSINSIRGVEQDVQGLYYHYYYYYDDGQTVAAIIFLDILLPIACCIGIIITIVCVVRAVQRRKAR